jgi:MoaA/NifB/PqqE/SkfB family radical SAM enzyme
MSPIPLIGFPADEESYGGCQAGGRGLLHISPRGDVEPCPAVHIAADSLADVSLETALASPFFAVFRRHSGKLDANAQSCQSAGSDPDFANNLAECGAGPTVSDVE